MPLFLREIDNFYKILLVFLASALARLKSIYAHLETEQPGAVVLTNTRCKSMKCSKITITADK